MNSRHVFWIICIVLGMVVVCQTAINFNYVGRPVYNGALNRYRYPDIIDVVMMLAVSIDFIIVVMFWMFIEGDKRVES